LRLSQFVFANEHVNPTQRGSCGDLCCHAKKNFAQSRLDEQPVGDELESRPLPAADTNHDNRVSIGNRPSEKCF
jgi:hypothetical protein